MSAPEIETLRQALDEVRRIAIDGDDGLFRDALERCDAIEQVAHTALSAASSPPATKQT